MRHRDRKLNALPILGLTLMLAACGEKASDEAAGSESSAASENAFVWPASLTTVGNGYPTAGAPCRRVGETPATADLLDDSADLVGCPGAADGEATKAIVADRKGRVVKDIDGVTLLSVPRGDAASGGTEQIDSATDAKVAGTAYNATAEVPCGGYRNHPSGMCAAGVVRKKDGSADVTVSYPGGADTRTIFFDAAGKVIGADTDQADGSAKFDVKSTRKGQDVTVITIGPEHYEIVDAFVRGG